MDEATPAGNEPQPGAGSTPQVSGEAPQPSEGSTDDLREKVVEVLRDIYDPEIPVNIYELGLIYDIAVDASRFVSVQMTLTAPGCPVAVSLPIEVETKVSAIPGVSGAKVDVVWDPPWDMSKMSEAARLQLGFM